MPQAAGQVKILIVLVKITFFPIDVNIFCDAGQVLILRYFEVWEVPTNEGWWCNVEKVDVWKR